MSHTVNRNFGSYVTHETKHFIHSYLEQVTKTMRNGNMEGTIDYATQTPETDKNEKEHRCSKDIFFLELISNSSDALDKIHCQSIADSEKSEAWPHSFAVHLFPGPSWR